MTQPFIIDVHGHIGNTPGFRPHWSSHEQLVQLMDTMATQVVIFSSMASLRQQFELGYAETLEVIEKHPKSFRAYGVFDPNWPDVSMRLLEQYLEHPGFVGIKIHPAWHETAPDDARYDVFWDFAEERNLPVLSHSWSADPQNPKQDLSTPERFATPLERHPGLRLILAHAGGREPGHRAAVELMKSHPNCWIDIAGDTHTLGLIEWFVAEVGGRRILYGTDAPWLDPRPHLGRMLKARLSDEERWRILRQNALDLFGEKLSATGQPEGSP